MIYSWGCFWKCTILCCCVIQPVCMWDVSVVDQSVWLCYEKDYFNESTYPHNTVCRKEILRAQCALCMTPGVFLCYFLPCMSSVISFIFFPFYSVGTLKNCTVFFSSRSELLQKKKKKCSAIRNCEFNKPFVVFNLFCLLIFSRILHWWFTAV